MSLYSRRIRRAFLKLQGMRIGEGTIICRNSQFRNCKNIEIGKGCVVNPKCMLDGRGAFLKIGDNVDIAQETNIWTMSHNTHTHESVARDVLIEDYVWVGSRATILPGITIGHDAIVGTGAVVTKDVPPSSVVGGVPARIITKRNRTKDYKLSFNSLLR